jgi:hypothetical protein
MPALRMGMIGASRVQDALRRRRRPFAFSLALRRLGRSRVVRFFGLAILAP